MIPPEARFVWDIDALREIQKYPHTRNLVEASAILRRLLLESECLLHKVSRNRDFQARFEMFKPVEPMNHPKSAFEWSNPDPSSVASPKNTQSLNLDAFLREPICTAGSTKITVKEVILYVANVGGGVHLGRPRNKDNAKSIDALANNGVWFGSQPIPIMILGPICNIVVKALMPLYQKVRA